MAPRQVVLIGGRVDSIELVATMRLSILRYRAFAPRVTVGGRRRVPETLKTPDPAVAVIE